MKPLTAQAFMRFWERLEALKQRHIPQLCVTGIAVFSSLTGWLFLVYTDRFERSLGVQHLTTTIPPVVWGITFLTAGAFLGALAWADYTYAMWPCLIFAVVMFGFTAASAFDFFDGPATGLISILAAAVGWFAVTTSLLCTAPRAVTILREDQ